MIGYRDALSIQVRGSVLSKKSRKEIKAGVVHFGGYPIEATLEFRGMGGESRQYTFPVLVLMPFSKKSKHIKIAESVPTILGLDILKHPNVSLPTDPNTGEFYIEVT